jgi:Tol biopolymer transport system component
MGLRRRRLQRTSFRDCSGTRWSPDGGLIAFDSRFGGESNLHTVDPMEGIPAKLNIDVSDNSQPGWSQRNTDPLGEIDFQSAKRDNTVTLAVSSAEHAP